MTIPNSAPLNSPALTGTPTAPTPTVGDNTTKVATTAFVGTAVAGGSGVPPTIQGAQGTNLGATQTIDFANTAKEVWLVGTLSANLTVTLTNRVAGARAALLVSQDATGGRTLTISDGSAGAAVQISATANSLSVLSARCPDATNIDVAPYGGVTSSIDGGTP